MSERLLARVRGLLDDAEQLGPTALGDLREIRARLDGPLRVAVAGRLKAGKSTLLNALIKERIAATDAGECTRVVTWYRWGPVYGVSLIPADGSAPEPVSFGRGERELDIDLGHRTPGEVRRLEVERPSDALRQLLLLDTPGLDSSTQDVSDRTIEALGPGGSSGEADAVIYLIRHLHPSDVTFLESFYDEIAFGDVVVNAACVVSRSDEIGDCRVNSMTVARRVAERYRDDPRIRSRSQTVLPVAGLLAEGAEALTEADFDAFRTMAAADRPTIFDGLVSAERFVGEGSVLGLEHARRQQLLDRFGLFGVRCSVELLRVGAVSDSTELSHRLADLSGISDLRDLLERQFMARGQVLKARSALQAIAELAMRSGPAGRPVLERARDTMFGAHEFTELSALHELRQLTVDDAFERAHAERLLGADGPDPAARLGAAIDTPADELRRACLEEIGYWKGLSEDPIMRRRERDLARAVTQSCEAVLMALTPTAPGASA
ncbi:MAG: dynamin family protein [Actinomycetota bacterium]